MSSQGDGTHWSFNAGDGQAGRVMFSYCLGPLSAETVPSTLSLEHALSVSQSESLLNAHTVTTT